MENAALSGTVTGRMTSGWHPAVQQIRRSKNVAGLATPDNVLVRDGKMQLKTKVRHVGDGARFFIYLHARGKDGTRLLADVAYVPLGTSCKEQVEKMRFMCDVFATRMGYAYRLDRKHIPATPVHKPR